MTVVELHQSGLLAKSSSNLASVLLAQICSIRSLTISILRIFVLRPSFFARLSVCQAQGTKLPRSEKMAAASGMASTMQTNFQSRSFCCHGLLGFNAGGHWQLAKLRSTSSPVRSLANGRLSRLKALSNDRFSPRPLDGKRGGDGRSIGGSRGAKVGRAFSEDTLLIIWSH